MEINPLKRSFQVVIGTLGQMLEDSSTHKLCADSNACKFLDTDVQHIFLIIIIWFGDTVTVVHLTKCNTNSKVRAMSA